MLGSEWYMRHVEEVEHFTGKPYLQYTRAKKAAGLDLVSLQGILTAAQTTFANRFNQTQRPGTPALSFDEVDELMRDWVSGNTIGSKIDAAMQNIVQFDQFGQATKYGTSGGIGISGTDNGQGGEITLSQALSQFAYKKNQGVSQINKICDTVDNAINNIILTLAENKEYLLVEAVVNQYYSGKQNLPANIAAQIPSEATIKQGLLRESDAKVAASVQTLKEQVSALQSLAKSGTTRSNGAKDLYNSCVKTIQQTFNTLGGSMHEIAVAHTLCAALGIGNGAIKKTNAQIANIVASGDGKFYANYTAEEQAVDGKEVKNDVTIFWNSGGIVFEFGGTVKLRQGRGFKGSGSNSEALGVAGFIARKAATFGELAKTKLNSELVSYAYSVAGATAINADIASWNALKYYAGGLLLVDAISGLGEKSDFSTLLIVNNRIFSISDILKRILEQASGLLTRGANKVYEVEGMNIYRVKQAVEDARESVTISKGQNQKTEEAKIRNREAYRLLTEEKISITLNLGHLYGSKIFM